MITYKDMTWCSQACGNEDCFRNYTPEQRERNEGGVDLPLSQADFRTDDCGMRPIEEPRKCSCGLALDTMGRCVYHGLPH